MKKIFLLLVAFLCIVSNCFAETIEVETKYDAEKNEIKHEFDCSSAITRKTRLPKSKTVMIKGFNCQKYYNFNKNFDATTGKCNPKDLIVFLLMDYDNTSKLVLLADDVLCTQIETGVMCVLPAKHNYDSKWRNNGERYTTHSYVLETKDAPGFLTLIRDGKPINLAFKFIGDDVGINNDDIALKNLREVLNYSLDADAVKQLKSVVDYDLYQDPTQIDNIKKAVAARNNK